MPEVLLGLLRVPRHHRTKQGRHINAPSPDIGALQVLLGLKCHLSFHLGPCLHLKKNQLSLRWIIPGFISLSSGLSPSLPMLLAVGFSSLESAFSFKSFVGYFTRSLQCWIKSFCCSGRGRGECTFLHTRVHFRVFSAGFEDGGVSEPPLAGRSAVNTSKALFNSRRRLTLSLLPGLMCWGAVNLENLS